MNHVEYKWKTFVVGLNVRNCEKFFFDLWIVYNMCLLYMWNFNHFSIVEKNRRERIAIIKEKIWIASIRLLCWNRGCGNRTILSTKLIIVPLLWQRLEWELRNLPENIVL